MKKILMAAAAFCCAMTLTVLTACTSDDDDDPITSPTVTTDTIRYHFASQEEGRRLRMDNTAYFESLTQNDIDWKLAVSGKSLDEFKALAAGQIEDFTAEEKQALSKTMDFIEARCKELGFRLPCKEEIVFIKTKMDDEGHVGGYTLKNEIYLCDFETERFARAYQGDATLDADYREYRIHLAREIVSHEIFHTLSRNDAEFRQLMYNLIVFTIMDHEIEFGPTVKNMLLHNPDVERYDNYADFTINGQKHRCTLIAAYPSSYADAAAVNPDANFFYDMQSVLVPLDEPDTMIPISDASDFYSVIGHNTDYVCAAEECMADNFSFLIAYGFNGRYDHWVEDNKIHFIPYETPQLIRNMHNTLLEHFAIKH